MLIADWLLHPPLYINIGFRLRLNVFDFDSLSMDLFLENLLSKTFPISVTISTSPTVKFNNALGWPLTLVFS